jgi:hypothetical protein
MTIRPNTPENRALPIGVLLANLDCVPRVTLRTGIASNGQEEVLHEYLCDWPDCPNVAVNVLGFVREIGLVSVVCDEHASTVERPKDDTAR